jgi:hypothetical protein
MPFPAGEEKIVEEEERIGRRLPDELRERIAADNGGEIEVLGDFASEDPADNVWQLVGVTDVWEKKGRPRPVDGIHKVTEEHREHLEQMPADAWVVATDGEGNVLLLMPDDSLKVLWLDADELDDATVDWSPGRA